MTEQIDQQTEQQHTPGRVEGKTFWEFACDWYSEPEIIDSVVRVTVDPDSSWQHPPASTDSAEFGIWLTKQYRLAMNKGLEIGNRPVAAMAARIQELVAEQASLYDYIQDLQQRLASLKNHSSDCLCVGCRAELVVKQRDQRIQELEAENQRLSQLLENAPWKDRAQQIAELRLLNQTPETPDDQNNRNK